MSRTHEKTREPRGARGSYSTSTRCQCAAGLAAGAALADAAGAALAEAAGAALAEAAGAALAEVAGGAAESVGAGVAEAADAAAGAADAAGAAEGFAKGAFTLAARVPSTASACPRASVSNMVKPTMTARKMRELAKITVWKR